MNRVWIPLMLGIAVVGLAIAAHSQAAAGTLVDFPQAGRSISLFVGYPAGGGADQAARLLAAMMEKEIGTPISVINKVGAGGQVGLTELVRSKPDGYTLGYAIFPFAATSFMDPRRQAIYKRTSFQPIAGQFENPKVIVVQAGSPYKSMKELVEAAKANPEKVKAAAGGVLGDTHLSLLQLEKVAGIKLALVHFQGGADGAAALLGGHVDMGSHVPPEILSHYKSGAVRALGVSGKQESRYFPGAKTLESQGYPVDVLVVGGLIAPAGVPKDVVDILSRAAGKVIQGPEHNKRIEQMGYTVVYRNPEQFAKFWAEAEEQFRPIMEQATR